MEVASVISEFIRGYLGLILTVTLDKKTSWRMSLSFSCLLFQRHVTCRTSKI